MLDVIKAAQSDLSGFKWTSDEFIFGKRDYWAIRSFEPRKRWAGDCDDYACTAANHLNKSYGVAWSQLHLVYCGVGDASDKHGNHLVLWVTDKAQLSTAKVRVMDCNHLRNAYHPAQQYSVYWRKDIRWISYHTLSWRHKSDWRKLRNGIKQ